MTKFLDAGPLIPFYRPFKLNSIQLQHLGHEISAILESGMLTNGENVLKFQEAIQKLYHVDHVIACSSGTAALWATLKRIGVKGSVEAQAFTWSSLLDLLPAGQIIFTDIQPDTWLMRSAWVGSTIIATHTFGNVFELDRTDWDGKLVYDAAQSFGAKIKDFGDATVFSFAPTKTITSMEGGAVLTNDTELAYAITDFRNVWCRMSEIHAAVGLAYLKHLDDIMERKRSIWLEYIRKLPFVFQRVLDHHSFGIIGCLIETREKRDELVKKLAEKGLETRIYYKPLVKEFKVTDDVYHRMICLPCYVGLEEWKVVEIIKSVME